MANVTFYENPIPPMTAPGLPNSAGAQAVTDNIQAALAILAARGVTGV